MIYFIRKNRMIVEPEAVQSDKVFLIESLLNYGMPRAFDFNYVEIKESTLNFVDSMCIDRKRKLFKYSQSSNQPDIYSKVYAFLIMSLYNQFTNLLNNERENWKSYFDSFQNPVDGLFYDNAITNEIFYNNDWWGARHLGLHVTMVYAKLGLAPKHKLIFLEKYYQKTSITNWLDNFQWDNYFSGQNDIDNKIMNIGGLLQYSRDYLEDRNAGESVKWLIEYLYKKMNRENGLWGTFDASNRDEVSRMVQFAYHLYSILFYDEIEPLGINNCIDIVLSTQNKLGGYGASLNSSACEDMDSIFLLGKLSELTNHRKEDVVSSLRRNFVFVLSNMNPDGGFVFKRNEDFQYGHKLLFAAKNESSMFPTWFRTLSIACLVKSLGIQNSYSTQKIPGYEIF